MASPDVPLIVKSPLSSSERRITPSWTISQLKRKLEPITGIPYSDQKLLLKLPDGKEVAMDADNGEEDRLQIERFGLVAYAEIQVSSRNPSSTSILPPPSSVPKYIMSTETYSSLPSTVLAYKKAHQIGRFNPSAPEIQDQKVQQMWAEIQAKGIHSCSRCRLSPNRCGTVRYVGLIPEIPGLGPWVGIELDEPTGKNDGSINGKKYFDCEKARGIFVRAERVEMGDWDVLDLEDEGAGSEMEEI